MIKIANFFLFITVVISANFSLAMDINVDEKWIPMATLTHEGRKERLQSTYQQRFSKNKGIYWA